MRLITVIPLCVMLCSCAILRHGDEWTNASTKDPSSPWSRKIDVAFTNIPLPVALAELERKANEVPGPKLAFSICRPVATPWRVPAGPVNFTATNIPVGTAFTILGDVEGFRTFCHGYEGVFADKFRKGYVSICLTGSCVDKATGKPIQGTLISYEVEDPPLTGSGEYHLEIHYWGHVDFLGTGDGRRFDVRVTHKPFECTFLAIAPGYRPQEVAILTDGTNLSYAANVKMTRDGRPVQSSTSIQRKAAQDSKVEQSESDWVLTCPEGPSSPWCRTVDFESAAIPLPELVAGLEAKANAQPGPKVSLQLCCLYTDKRVGNAPFCMGFTATNITVLKAFTIIGKVSGYKPMFRGHEGILARPVREGYEGDLSITGRCVDVTTGRPVQRLSVVRSFMELEVKGSGEYQHEVQVPGSFELMKTGDGSYTVNAKPKPQKTRFVVKAPSYETLEFAVSPAGSTLIYTNNITMIRNSRE